MHAEAVPLTPGTASGGPGVQGSSVHKLSEHGAQAARNRKQPGSFVPTNDKQRAGIDDRACGKDRELTTRCYLRQLC